MGRYKWKESQALFKLYVAIFEAGEISLQDLEKKLNKTYNAISEQSKTLIEEKLVTYKLDYRKHIFQINKAGLKKAFGITDIKKIKKALPYLQTFNMAKQYFVQGPFEYKETGYVSVDSKLFSELLKTISKQGNTKLKEKAREVKRSAGEQFQ